MDNVYGYTRVSSLKQGDGVSLVEQKSAIVAFAKNKNLHISRWFEEKQTAAKQGRPEFNQMITLLDRDKASGAIFHKVNRSTRNFGDWHALSLLADKGVQFYSAIDGIDIFEDSRRILSDIEVVMAAGYIRDLKKEVKKGFYGRLKQGYYPMTAPIGYKDMGGGQKKVIDPIMGPLIQEMFELYCTRKFGFEGLVNEMRIRGLRNKGGGKVTRNGIARILGNPFYYGLMKINKTGETFEGNHEPLIDQTLFNKVQMIRDGKSGRKILKHDFPYRRTLKCLHCNYTLIGERQKGHIYYRCHTKNCLTKSIRQFVINNQVDLCLHDVSLNEYQIKNLRREISHLISKEASEDGKQVNEIRLAIASLENKLDRLADAVVDGVIDTETYTRKKRQLMEEKLDLQSRINEISNENYNGNTKLEKFLELLKTLEVQRKKPNQVDLPILLSSVTSNLQFDGKNLMFTCLLPFGLIAKSKNIDYGEPSRTEPRTASSGSSSPSEPMVLRYCVGSVQKNGKDHPVDVPKLARDIRTAL